MTVVHRITGYDKRTERLEREHDVPGSLLSRAKTIAKVPRTDKDAVGSYPLDPDQARAIATLLRLSMDVDRYDWFLEPFAEEDVLAG